MKTKNTYSLPVRKKDITEIVSDPRAHFAHFKHAIDFCVPEGSDVLASLEGIVWNVVQDNDEGGDGEEYADKLNFITIKHDNEEYSQYGHLQKDSAKVKIGDKVTRGQHIAQQGSTGWTTEPHIHLHVFIITKDEIGWDTLEIKFDEKVEVYRPKI